VKVLLLGGTAEARELADRLNCAGVPFVSSLAGRVSRPRLPVGEVRIGGFGGPQGLRAYIVANDVTDVVDATHPFATTMAEHACQAAASAGVRLLRFARPGWSGRGDATGWHWASTLEEVREIASGLGRRPFVTSGRQTLGSFASWSERTVLIRVVEPVDELLPPSWMIIHDRGPYVVAGEIELMSEHAIDVLITKDSGGDYTSAKLDAAAALGVPVVVLSRPVRPSGLTEVSSVGACVESLLRPPP